MKKSMLLVILAGVLNSAGCDEWDNKSVPRNDVYYRYPSDLEIQDGWTWTPGDYGYTYIRGRVRNIGSESIKYFKVRANYIGDNGQVLDTDYTSSDEILKSGWTKKFKIKHKYNREYTKVVLYVAY